MAKNIYVLITDYIAFIVIVLMATVVPLWSRFFGRKKTRTKADYVFATGAVSMFSMMLSIARGTLGVRSFLGFPSEQFYRGAGMWETIYGMVNAYPIVAFVFIPVYFNLKITSVYQYIELRFNSRLVRCLASGTYIFRSILNLGVTVFTPTIAIYTIIGIPIWASLTAITLISIVFNLLGGLKQAITADVIQLIVTIVVSMAIIFQAVVIAGGVGNVYEENRNTGRLNFFNFTGDLTVRVDTTSAWLGQLFMSLSLFGCQQNFVQRYLSMKSVKQVSRMLMLNIPVIIVLFSLSWIVGMCIYSVYSDCDPLKAGFTTSTDAILPFYVEDKFSYIPGIMGIFLSTIFTSALILNVSNLNSLATVTWEDFLSDLPILKELTDKKQLQIIKFIGSCYGLMIMGVGFSVQFLSGVIESAQLMTSATSGPLLGVFLLAILVPFANWKGASLGMVLSHVIILSITCGRLLFGKVNNAFLETSIDGCTNETFSSDVSGSFFANFTAQKPVNLIENATTSEILPVSSGFMAENVFSISYMYYSLFGMAITVIVGIVISLLTMSTDDAYESKYIHPIVYKIATKFPGHARMFKSEKDFYKIDHTVVKLEDSGYSNQAYDENSEDLRKNVVKLENKTSQYERDLASERYRKVDGV